MGADDLVWELVVKADDMRQVRGSYVISRFFGVSTNIAKHESMAENVVGLQLGLANKLVGVFGMLIALLTCAGFVPSMLQKGALDLTLAHPIGRGRLLLFKYMGGLWFILIVTTVTIVGSMLVLAVRTGIFNPWFLGTIPIMVLSFAVIYSLVVFMGVLTRSGTIAGLLGVGTWWIAETTHMVRHALRLGGEWDGLPGWGQGLLNTTYWVLPKTQDLGLLNRMVLSKSELSPEAYDRLFGFVLPEVDWWFSVGTTAAFAVAMLGLAMWVFKRRDY
jgi:ABC-type transport system involved in multi-copper enzyme maturation permease subunit